MTIEDLINEKIKMKSMWEEELSSTPDYEEHEKWHCNQMIAAYNEEISLIQTYRKAFELICDDFGYSVECENCPKEIFNRCGTCGKGCLLDSTEFVMEHYLKKANENNIRL